MKKEFLSETGGERLDVFLARTMTDYSRGYFQRLIGSGSVTVNDATAPNSHRELKPGDLIAVCFPDEIRKTAAEEDIPIEILHEDDAILVINKAPGIVVHPACGHASGTLLNALAGHARGRYTPLLVHRLDKDTSGLMVVAKTEQAKNSLVSQFQKRIISKTYLVAVAGCVHEAKGRIEAPLGRSPDDRKKIAVGPTAKKPAVTEFTVLKRFPSYSLLEAHPVTGRTHQIRSHMVYIGHPVLGDSFYGGPERLGDRIFKRQMLHAYQLSFKHPLTARTVTFHSPLPEDMDIFTGAKPAAGATPARAAKKKRG